ncbi:Uncharacterised protein [Streptococcus pneumoniae]|nr:Uncharacterised protein [Streptococcus pneumoniae]
MSFRREGQVVDSFLKFSNGLINRILLGTAKVAIERANSFFSFFYGRDAFCSITVQVFWYLVKCLLCRFIISCEVFSVGICKMTHEFEEA